MGVFDSYLDVQLKLGDPVARQYELGDKVHIPDGIYMGWEGIVVVHNGKFIARHRALTTKWGNKISPKIILEKENPSPLLESPEGGGE